MDTPRLVQTQPPRTGSECKFHWICLFSWCENHPEPFEIYVREATRGYIPDSWFNKPLSESHRHQKARFEPFGDQHFSVFCKIEYGKTKKRKQGSKQPP